MSEVGPQNGRLPAVLALADGSLFFGFSLGANGQTVGEVVFNTSMTGYQEILTDPSYAEQIVTLTYPHIGNVGINPSDCESHRAWAAGLIIREPSPIVSNWRAEQSLEQYLKSENIVAIAGVDTRRLTRLLRTTGAQNGCILAGEHIDADEAIRQAKAYPGLQNKDLAKDVCTQTIEPWHEGSLTLAGDAESTPREKFHAVVYDYGVKHNILRLLVDQGFRVTLVPAQASLTDVLALKPDGVLLSNGPGDPAACDYAIKNIQQLMAKRVPLFGICLGFQLLALACGAKTVKMKFGHHGANHPVQDLKTGRVFITSQNHSFAVDENTLPSDLAITHRSLFDNTLQGIAHKTVPAMAFQGHPEASPGPHDIVEMFRDFVELCQKEPI
ncbi:glutamine-hydrolyzing carbamoyl-phosphate synthase small subunit [Candidiatus Paracoxiella cheracis]|uniref:glutamine-hydrolyzing carbamoyl-phosphate synthase small subunit n=1 Tax=Candidiatus Paracoxiella cheracis TaxID=3405120 RepID=UPI003BF59A02